MTKIFVGTLEAGEAEFLECQRALSAQIEVEICHYVISGKPERKAHKLLFQYWLSRRHEFDYFLKLDADTVLMRPDAISQMSNLMRTHDASGLQVRLLDYFSGTLIPGLNMFSPEVKFGKRSPRLHPDTIDRQHRLVLKGQRVANLEPIAFHGLDPNPKQSFYYGFHRFLKGQRGLLRSVHQLWKIESDLARRWALIGAVEGFKWHFSQRIYSSQWVNYRFERLKTKKVDDQVIDDFCDLHLTRGDS